MRKRVKKTRQARIIGAVVLALVLIVGLVVFHGPVMRAVGYVSRPFVGTATWLTQRFTLPFSAPGSQDQIELLLQQRNALTVDTSKLQALERENEQLRALLGFTERRDLPFVPARIISRSGLSSSARFMLDKGSDDGVVEGAPVIVDQGIIVGKVTKTTKTTATVTVLTQPTVRTAGTLLNETRTIGVVEAAAGNLLQMRFIPQDETIEVNDVVVTSGLEDNVPSGLSIGVVNSVESQTAEPFQQAIIEPLIDIRHYHQVAVLTVDR